MSRWCQPPAFAAWCLSRSYWPARVSLSRLWSCEPLTAVESPPGAHGPQPGDIVQIGAVVVPPDFTGDINNYTIWYYTSDLRLALRLLEARVGAQFVPTMDYDVDPEENTLHVRVPLPGLPRLVVSGNVFPSDQSAGSFTANWWQEVNGRKVKMSTNVPSINIGGADLTLTTNSNGPLGQLIGGSATGFPIIQQFNTFADATMNVSSH